MMSADSKNVAFIQFLLHCSPVIEPTVNGPARVVGQFRDGPKPIGVKLPG